MNAGVRQIAEYRRWVGERHGKAFGQYFTPPEIAEFMVSWALESGVPSLYDPAFGLGAFRRAADVCGGVAFAASEADPRIVEFWRRGAGRAADFVRIENYLESWGRSRDNIVCNPPYMKFHRFPNKAAVLAALGARLGARVSGYTNVASAFLLKSLLELRPGGRLAYIMPLEFLNTGYGALAKRKLSESGHLYAVVNLRCEQEIFPDAITSVGIILYDSARRHDTVKFYDLDAVGRLAALDAAPPVSEPRRAALDPGAKWLPYFRRQAPRAARGKTVPLAHYGRFRRGVATGANEFFVLKPSRARERGVEAECAPCISRSAQIRRPVFGQAQFEALRAADKDVLLFSVGAAHSARAAEYIRHGERHGFHERFLTRNRRPWHRTERGSPSPLLLGVFSRGGYKAVLNESGATNLTCYHGFAPNAFGGPYLEHLFLYMLSGTGRALLSLASRKYGADLDKFEPNDLNGALAPSPAVLSAIPREAVAAAMLEVRETDRFPEWAEEFFASLTSAPGPA